MNIRKIEVFDYATEIIKALSKGAVITAKADNRVNAMTISWGTLGREWERKIFTIFIRETRYTHELLEKNSRMKEELLQHFPGALKNDKIDRGVLGKLVYGNPRLIETLNNITHKYVISEMDKRSEAGNTALDALYLFESGYAKKCDKTIAVVADLEVRIKRIMERDGIDREYAMKKILSQKPNEFYMQNADYVIYNNQDRKYLEGEIETWLKILN